jgi:hypothetical protein
MLRSYIWGMKKSSTTLLMNARALHYTYDRGSLSFKSILYIILMLMILYECKYVKALKPHGLVHFQTLSWVTCHRGCNFGNFIYINLCCNNQLRHLHQRTRVQDIMFGHKNYMCFFMHFEIIQNVQRLLGILHMLLFVFENHQHVHYETKGEEF